MKKTYAQWEVVNNHGPETWRRMIYQERMRRVDDRIFTAFDFPDCGQVRAKRPVSTTPLQALNLMNSDFVVTQSALLAERAEKEAGKKGSCCSRGSPMLRASALTHNRTAAELKACMQVAEGRWPARRLPGSHQFQRIRFSSLIHAMNPADHISSIGHGLLNRRNFMRNTGAALGGLGLAGLLAQDGLLASDDPANFSGKTPIRPDVDS